MLRAKVGKDEFFRSYRLGSMKRNIIITPDEFLTNADKKSGDYSLIVHHPMNDEQNIQRLAKFSCS